MIRSFGDDTTKDVFDGANTKDSRRFPVDLHPVASRKLDMVNAANSLEDLKIPPGNRLEALKDDLKGFHSIRINAQWRIIFRWVDGDAHEVRIVDYH